MNSAPPDPDDAALLLAVARRDEAAFASLYDRMARAVFSLIVRVVRSRAEAEEVLQESFCWIVTIARRKAIDRLRANSRHLQRIEDAQGARVDDKFTSPMVIEALATDERGAVVRAALAKLGPEERRAIALAFFDGLTHLEIATAEGAPVGTIKARIRRGMLKLKPALARLGGVSEI